MAVAIATIFSVFSPTWRPRSVAPTAVFVLALATPLPVPVLVFLFSLLLFLALFVVFSLFLRVLHGLQLHLHFLLLDHEERVLEDLLLCVASSVRIRVSRGGVDANCSALLKALCIVRL